MPNLALDRDAQLPSFLAAQSTDWHALYTRARFERRISQQIQLKHHESYVPVVRARHRWSDRYQTVETPIFPGYVFVRATQDAALRLAILQTNGVHAFVAFNGAIAQISDEQINDLRRLEEHRASWSQHPYLKTGSRVRIVGGCLDGLEGIFLAERSRKLVISIEPMQRSIAIDIEGYHVEMV